MGGNRRELRDVGASARRHAILVAAVAVLACPAAAGASTVTIAGGDTVSYSAVAGEVNNLTIAREPTLYRVKDSGAAITPTAPCATVTANEATCPAAGITNLSTDLGDLADNAAIDASVTSVGATLFGNTGADTLTGGANVNTRLSGFDDGDFLFAGAAGATLEGGNGADTLTGGPAGDSLSHGPGADSVSGGGGDDFFSNSGSDADPGDTFSGGEGIDRLDYTARFAPLNLTLDGVADDGEAAEGDNLLPDLETVTGGDGNDNLRAFAGSQTLNGSGGNDLIFAGEGDDSISPGEGDDMAFGESGNDQIFSSNGADLADGGDDDDVLTSGSFLVIQSDGADVFAGGGGTDTVRIPSARDPLSVSLDGNADDGVAGEGDNFLADVEGIAGGRGPDTLSGNASANQITGGDGADTILGLGGEDGLVGERGDDTLDGGEGTDSLEGEAGADRLRSRDSGPDEAACGAGADTVLADVLDALAADCESASSGVVIAAEEAKLSDKGKTSVELACPAAEGAACAGELELVSQRKLKAGKGKKKQLTLATADFSIAAGATEAVELKLTKKAEQAIGKAKKTAADATATITDAAGIVLVTSGEVLLKQGGKG